MIDKLKKLVAKYNLTTIQLAHFAGQLSHESFDFKITSENLNYSAERLLQVFPKYFTKELAQKYARKPISIANRVYANRMGNNDEKSGDGWKFRGRGYIQLTGKNNYSEFDKFVSENILENPDLVSTKYPLLSAAWFFSKNCLHKCVDASDATVTSVTKCVNGGTIGLADRIKHFKEYYNLLK